MVKSKAGSSYRWHEFLLYVIPSMLTMLMNGFYVIVDGFFIGRAVGDVGLAAIGIIWPVAAVLIAVGMGIGVGGSVAMSIYRGVGENEKANTARGNVFFLLAVSSIILTVIFLLLNPYLVTVLGGKGQVYEAALEYINIVSVGGCMQICASGLIPLLRNSKLTLQAMFIMGTGLVCNIILDAVFTLVIPCGLAGAAIATIISQFITVIGAVFTLKRQKVNPISWKSMVPQRRIIAKILKIGISPFGLSLMPSIIAMLNNWQCLAYGGDLAVSAYSVISYYYSSITMLLTGIGEGIQPLVSYYHGAKDTDSMKWHRHAALKAIVLLSGIFILISFPATKLLPVLYNTSTQTGEIIAAALPIMCIAFPLMGISHFYSSYYYSSGKSFYAGLLVYADPVIFTPICVIILPYFFKLNGVWMALPAAQIMVIILLVIIKKRKVSYGN